MFRDEKIPIKRAVIGAVNKKDVLTLEEGDDKHRVIFAFNTKVLDESWM